MNKRDLAERISDMHDLTLKKAQDIVEDVFEEIKQKIAQGTKVRIVGFGSFEIRKRAARMGRNPHTGEKMMLEETMTPAFSPGIKLLKTIKGTCSGS